MGLFTDLWGTTKATFQIALAGVKLKNSSGNLLVRNAADNADAAITASKVNVSGEEIVINSDAAGSGADWTYTLKRPASGQGGAVSLTLPVDDGTSSQFLQTDGSGNLSWAAGGDTSPCDTCNETTIAHGTSSPASLFNLPANGFIDKVMVIVDVAFNGTTPNMSVGISGTTSKYVATTDVDLTTTGVYEVHPGVIPVGTSEALIATLSAGSSATGSARVQVYYTIPA